MSLRSGCCDQDELKQFEVDVSGTQGMEDGGAGKPIRHEVCPNLNDSTVGATEQDDWLLSSGVHTKQTERQSLAGRLTTKHKRASPRNGQDMFKTLKRDLEIQSQAFNDRHQAIIHPKSPK